MPINPGTGLFARVWKFVDRFVAAEEVKREDLDAAIDDLIPAINAALAVLASAQAAADQAQAQAAGAANAGATAGAAAGGEAAVIAAAAQVAQAAVYKDEAETAKDAAEGFAAIINPLNLVGLVAETPFAGDLNGISNDTRAIIYRLAAGVSNGPATAGDRDFLLHLQWDADDAMQILFDANELSLVVYRSKVTGSWGQWIKVMTTSGDQSLTGGYTTTAVDDGTKTAGTYIPSPVGGNMKRCVNGGPFTLAAPIISGDYSLVIQMTNNASAGIVSFSGFTKVVGSSMTTTSGNDYMLYITKVNGFTLLSIEALQ